jgi:hypothetical protein
MAPCIQFKVLHSDGCPQWLGSKRLRLVFGSPHPRISAEHDEPSRKTETGLKERFLARASSGDEGKTGFWW